MALHQLLSGRMPTAESTTGPVTHRANNLDALRLLAAAMVLLAHQHALMRLPYPRFIGVDIGALGVTIFFALSGMLVAQSWLSDPHALRFAVRRLLRIWPGLAACVLVMALVVGPLFMTLPLREYFASEGTHLFVLQNLKFKINFVLPGVFEANPFATAVNGSLWTIPIEVVCYAFIGLVGLLGIVARGWLLLLVSAALACWIELRFMGAIGHSPAIRSPKYDLLLVFMLGACALRLRPLWMARPLPWVLGCLAWAALAWWRDSPLWLGNAMAVFVVCAAYRSATPVLRRAGRFGDLSYGLYIYGFVVQQSLLALGIGAWGVGAGLGVSLAVTLACAWISWHAVERPALRYKPAARIRTRPLQATA